MCVSCVVQESVVKEQESKNMTYNTNQEKIYQM